ncbi:peptidoglycan editing factor PgeF [Aurantimonas coralicida]|uniref:peptidoglycan editing factor PgeF n=1 Tax=Aurantimonas coralicida TaxID=182270 RepID=UPI00040B4173|nr:peptidoglycan editing factor PgeF [Aurantimonas coralicida]
MSDIRSRSASPLPDSAVVRSDRLAGPDIAHAFFTRRGGVSEGLYAGLNVGIGSNDRPEDVLENRARALATLGSADLATPWQVHSADAVVLDAPFSGDRPRADGIATRRKGLAIGVVTADCGPVLFADTENGVIGAAHAGWRGALNGVLEATVAAMEGLGAKRNSIRAVLGPTITQPNYEVGLEMVAEFLDAEPARERFFQPGRSADKRQFDLPGFIVARLQASGVEGSFVDRCTYGEPDRFFSFRRTTHRGEPDYGRQLSAIALAE